jgi:membrane associated rhomboid family serine protease
MFLLLVSLKSRIVRWPIATIAILLVTAGASIQQFPAVTLQQRAFQAAQEDQPAKALESENETAGEKAPAAAKKPSHLKIIGQRLGPAAKALLLHMGWVDLAVGILAILIFAAFLEQRVGTVGLLLIYFVGGTGANLFQWAYAPPGAFMAGSSAAVSAILGAFFIYFHQEKSFLRVPSLGKRSPKAAKAAKPSKVSDETKTLTSLKTVEEPTPTKLAKAVKIPKIQTARTVSFPSWVLVGAFLAVSDLVCMLVGSQTTHIAHGAGFALGVILASMQKDLFPLKKTLLFPQEQKMYYSAKAATRFEDKLEYFRKIYQLNPESFYSFRSLFSYFEKHHLSLSSFRDEDRVLVTNILLECFRYSGKSEKYGYSLQVLGMVPLWWNLNSLELNVGADEIIDRAHAFQAQGSLAQGLRYYDFFLEKYAAHARAEQAHSVIMKVFDELERFDSESRAEIFSILTDYAKVHPTTHFQNQIRRIAQQVAKDRGHEAA